MLLKVLGIGICTIIVNLLLKQVKPEFAVLANVCGGLIMFLMVIEEGQVLINEYANLQDVSGVQIDIVSPILKVIGVGYITEFTSDLAEDCGNKSVADKVILGGKIAICLLALPIIKTLVNSIISLI